MTLADAETGPSWVSFGWDAPADDAQWLRWWMPSSDTTARTEMGTPCAALPPEWFDDIDNTLSLEAAGVCADCPTRAYCLEWAINTNQRAGVWGGLTTAERDTVDPAE